MKRIWIPQCYHVESSEVSAEEEVHLVPDINDIAAVVATIDAPILGAPPKGPVVTVVLGSDRCTPAACECAHRPARTAAATALCVCRSNAPHRPPPRMSSASADLAGAPQELHAKH